MFVITLMFIADRPKRFPELRFSTTHYNVFLIDMVEKSVEYNNDYLRCKSVDFYFYFFFILFYFFFLESNTA